MCPSEKNDPTFQLPGIGGALGKCAICGDDFVWEILMGKAVVTMHCSALKNDPLLPMHEKCADGIEKIKKWSDLPSGPLRTAFERQQESKEV